MSHSHHSSPRRRSAILALSLAALPTTALAERVSLDLGINPDDNQLSLTISASLALGTRSDYKFPRVSGNALADFDVDFSPTTHEAYVTSMELTGGEFAVSNTSFYLDWGFFMGSLSLSGKSIRGTFSTPNPPALTLGGNTFNAADHQATLNNGLLSATGTGLVGAYLPQDPYVIKLWESPMTGSGDGTGAIAITAPTMAGDIATYGLTLTLPVNFDQIVVDEYGATVRATGQGTFTATTQLTHSFAIHPAEWNTDGGGSWGENRHWNTGVLPNFPGAQAHFADALTAGNAPATIEFDGDETVGQLFLRNTNQYILGNTTLMSLILDNAGQDARIQVDSGSHVIGAPVRLVDSTQIEVNVSSALEITNGITAAAGKNLAKKGPGVLTTRGGIALDSASTLSVEGGTLRADRISAGTLRIAADALTILDSQAHPSPLSVVHALDLAGETDAWQGTLDINNSRLMIQADAQTAQQVLAQISNQIKTGRTNGWQGKGITSTAAQANKQTGLAVVLNNNGKDQPIFKTFDGVPADLNSIFVVYTWNGDITLDGVVDAADYFRIDSGFITQKGTYQNGDLNFDGKVDASDYFLIDSAFIAQTGPLSARPTLPVPEPTALSLLLLGSLPTLRRRHQVRATQ